MNKIVNWLLMLIVFVFDPLAIAMVVAANFAFSKKKPLTEELVEEIPKDDITHQVERKAEQVRALTPESDVTPSDPPSTQREYYGETEELNPNPFYGVPKTNKKKRRKIKNDINKE